MNKFCFGAIYNGCLWEKELGVSANHQRVASRIDDVLQRFWLKFILEDVSVLGDL